MQLGQTLLIAQADPAPVVALQNDEWTVEEEAVEGEPTRRHSRREIPSMGLGGSSDNQPLTAALSDCAKPQHETQGGGAKERQFCEPAHYSRARRAP